MGKIALYGTLSSAVGEPVVEASEVGGLEEALKPTRIKWMELKRLKDAKKLSPGHNYIITDYRSLRRKAVSHPLGLVGRPAKLELPGLYGQARCRGGLFRRR